MTAPTAPRHHPKVAPMVIPLKIAVFLVGGLIGQKILQMTSLHAITLWAAPLLVGALLRHLGQSTEVHLHRQNPAHSRATMQVLSHLGASIMLLMWGLALLPPLLGLIFR